MGNTLKVAQLLLVVGTAGESSANGSATPCNFWAGSGSPLRSIKLAEFILLWACATDATLSLPTAPKLCDCSDLRGSPCNK